MLARPRLLGLNYAWIIFGVTFLTLLASAGIRATPGVLIIPLEHEFGWNRAAVSGAISANLILYGLCGPFAAAFMERFGLRRVVLVVLLGLALGVALTTQMRQLWQFYVLWGLVVGGCTGAMATVLAAQIANRWFIARRGMVVGILTAAGATGQLIFLPSLASLVVAHGWRWASATVVLAILAAIPLVLLFMRDRPRDLGLPPLGGAEVQAAPAPAGNPFGAAVGGLRLGLSQRNFWYLVGSFFICGASTNGLIGTHLIPASMEHGISEVTAAGMLAVIGVFDVVGTTLSGWLTDRWDSRWLLFWYYALRGLSLLLLPFVLGSSFLGMIVFVVFYGLDWVATVPPTISLAADTFGRERVGIVYGWIFASHQLGAAAIAFGAGAIRTFFGDYQIAFITSGLLCLLAAGLVIRIRNSAPGPQVPEAVLRPQAAAATSY